MAFALMCQSAGAGRARLADTAVIAHPTANHSAKAIEPVTHSNTPNVATRRTLSVPGVLAGAVSTFAELRPASRTAK
jgi:hypothetical protein